MLGGARSGKSSWALHHTETEYRSPVFLATAQALDDEMTERIRRHRAARGDRWDVIEEPVALAEVLRSRCEGYDAVLVDCLTVWLSNLLLGSDKDRVSEYVDGLLEALEERRRAIILVANEVGMGIVPEHALGRVFRDLAGELNQKLAAVADKVVLVTAGLPLYLKNEE